jgi:hypothetical protein
MLHGTDRITHHVIPKRRDQPDRHSPGTSTTDTAPPTKQRPLPAPAVRCPTGSASTTAASHAHPASDPLPGATGYKTPRSRSKPAGHRAGKGLPCLGGTPNDTARLTPRHGSRRRPLTGLPTQRPAPPVSRRNRQPATGPPSSYPDRPGAAVTTGTEEKTAGRGRGSSATEALAL